MAKNNSDNFSNRIKKVVPENKWLVNVAKSLGFTSMEIIQDLLPNTTNFVDWNKDEISDTMNMIREMRSSTGIRNTFTKQFENIPQIKTANKALQNIKSDLKSGKFYNNDRLNSFDDDDMDWGFGDDFGDDTIEFIDDDDEDSSTPSESTSKPPVAVINTMPLAKAINTSTEATVNTMLSVAEQQMAVESQKIMFSQDSTNSIMNAIGSLNDNLSLLVEFNANSTAKYQAAAMKYYEQSLELLQDKKKEPDRDEKLSPFFDSGVFNFGDYKKIVKENIEDMVDSNMTASMIKEIFLNQAVLEGFAKNPIGTAVSMAIKAKLPGVVKSTISTFDESVNSIMPAIIARISSFEDSDNPLLKQLSKALGYEQKIDKKVKLGDYEKGAIKWDGESKKALVEVIPTYLRRIESALTGQDERVYNYDTGEFSSMDQLRIDFDKKLNEKMSSSYAYDIVRRQMEEKLNKLNASDDVIEKFNKSMRTYFAEMTERGHMVNPFLRKGPDGDEIDELTEILDGDSESANLIRRLMSGVSKHDLTNMVTIGVQDSVRDTQQFYDEIRANPNLSGYATLHNDKTVKDGVKYTGQLGPKDAFGLSQLDYLRDIRSVLIKGIRVFPDTRKRYRDNHPNQDMIDKERMEVENANKTQEKPKSIFDISNNISKRTANEILDIDEERWNEILGESKTEFEDNTLGRAMSKLDKVNKYIDDKVYAILFGDENYTDQLKEKIDKYKESRKGKKSIFTNVKEIFNDSIKATKSFFTGQPYITSDGITVEGNPNNIFNQIKGFFTGLPKKLYNREDGGLIGKFTEDFMDGFKQFKVNLFGEKALSEKAGKETIQDLGRKVKERLPKAIGYGIGGAAIKTVFASQLGVLGNFLLPGGPLGAALVGTTFGLLKQSETFNKYVFGEKDAEGNRVGGIISKAWQDKYKEYSGVIKKGAGLGILASLFLPGGPVTGAIMGIGTGILTKNEAFQEFLYGKDFDKDNKSFANGVFGKAFKKLSGGEDGNPKLAKFLGSVGLGVGVAQGIGLLPSFLLPGGPITGAMLGLAGGIAASSEKFQKFLFGEKDIDGKRYGGLMTQFTNWMNVSFMQPLKLKATAMADSVYGFMRKKLLDPITRSFEPVLYAFKNMAIDIKDGIVGAFQKVTSPIVEGFRDHVIKPLGKALGTIVNPIKKMIFGAFKMLGKGLLNVLTSPLSLIDAVGGMAERYNERSVLRREKRRRGKEFDKNDTGPAATRGIRRKLATRMSKDEKEALLNEELSYRKGMTRKERKKAQKTELKEEMQKRKNRRDEMQRQFEEDRAFAKDNKYKFASKKQKEERERMLQEKANWIQEQMLQKAEDNSEKVSKISDDTTLLNTKGDTIIDKLGEVKDAIVTSFNKLLGNQSSNNVIPMPKRDSEKGSTLGEKLEGNKVIDINKKLQEKGQSHADGLDEVPKDGYVAELHEGEMVVPKKPASKLRGLMGGLGNAIGGMANMFSSVLNAVSEDDKRDRNDNALGLSDEEAEQQKELLDRERKAKVSRKNVDFVQNKLAAEKKEKEERTWKDNILGAVVSLGKIASKANEKKLDLFDLLKKGFEFVKNGLGNLLGGLGNLGGGIGSVAASLVLPAAITKLIDEWADYKKTEEYQTSRTDVDSDGDGKGDFVYDNTDAQIARNIISARNPLVVKPAKTIKNKMIDPLMDGGRYLGKKGKDIYNSKLGQKTLKPAKEFLFGTKETTETVSNVVSFADAKLAKESGSGKLVKKAIGETTVTGGSKGIITKFIDVVKQALSFVMEKVAEKFPKIGNFISKADGILKSFVKNADTIVSKFSKKITAFITGLGVKSNPVGLAVDLVFAAGDFISGATAGNAGNLFGVSPENVDIKMRGISSVLQTLTNYNALAIISLVNEITSSMWNFNFLRNVAIWIYNAIPGGKDLVSRITSKQIDGCKSIEEALQIMQITDPNDIAQLQENGAWKDFSNASNESLGGVISPTEQMELARLQYNLANGTKLSSQAFVDKESKTLGSKIIDGTKKGFKKAKDSVTGLFKKDENGELGIVKNTKEVFMKMIPGPGGAAINGAMKVLSKHGDKVKGAVSKTMEKGKELAINVGGKISEGAGKLVNKGKELLGKGLEEYKEYRSNPLAYTLNKTADGLDYGWSAIKKGGKKVADTVGAGVDVVKDKVGGVVNKAKDKIKQGIDWMYEGTEGTAGQRTAQVVKKMNKFIADKRDEMLKSVADTVTNGLKSIGKSISETVNNIGEGIKNIGKASWEGIKNIGKGFTKVFKTIGDSLKDIGSTLWDGFKTSIKTLSDGFTKKVTELKEAISIENITKVASEKIKEVKDAVGRVGNSLKTIFDDIGGGFKNFVSSIQNFKFPRITVSDITMKFKDVTSFFTDFVAELFKKDDNAGSSGVQPTDKVKPVKHNISSSELLKPMTPSTTNNTTTNKTNNKFVFYTQSDSRWGNTKIGNKTLSDAGCGPTSLAMAVSQLTGEQITPDTVAQLGSEHLPGYSQYSLFPSVAQKLNMNYSEGNDAGFIMSNLKKGLPVLLSGKTTGTGTPYTSEGHIVTASHMSGNQVFIQDPRGEQYSGYYPLNSLLSGLNKGMVVAPSARTDVSKLSSGNVQDISMDKKLIKQGDLLYSDPGEYSSLNMGETGAEQVTVADRVLSYARAFLANTSKFKYSQAQSKTTGRHGIDNNNIGADCSSFVSHVMSVAGDRGKVAYLSGGWYTDAPGSIVSDPQIGDVVCQEGHVGIYSGDGKYIHMSGKRDGIKESKAIQRGNNRHKGYRRFLKDPSALVDPTIVGGNSLLGTVVATKSGQPVMSGGGTPGTPVDGSTPTASAPAVNPMGIFGQLQNIATNMVASLYNGKIVDVTGSTQTPADSSTPTTGTNPDIGNITDTAKAVWTFFTGKGYSPQATAGILGNMTQESGVDPTVIQGGGKGPAAGICQWENYNNKSARWKQMSDYAASKGKDWKDLQSQLEFVDMELSGTGNVDKYTSTLLKRYAGSYDAFKQETDINRATKLFEDSFERAGKPNMERRYSAAKTYYDQFKSGSSDINVGAGGGFTMATSAESAPADGSIPTSMNGWAYYKQGDPQWQEDINGKKIGPSGCGMASHAMMLTSMFGKQVTPVTVGKWARANGHWSNGMSWSMPDAIANKLGLKIVKSETNGGGLGQSSLDNLKAQLKAGYPAILSGQGNSSSYDTPFTGGGHIVFAVGVDGSGNVIINDPRSPQRTKAYTDDGIMNIGKGLRGYWAFDTTPNAKLPEDWAGGDFTATPGSSTPTDGSTPTASAPAVNPMGVFGQLQNIATNMVASLYNGKIVDVTSQATTSPTDGTTPGTSVNPTGESGWDGTKYDLSVYNMSDLSEKKQSHINKMIQGTLHTYKTHGLFPSLTIAQSVQESGWGLTSGLASKGHAAFGIKADKSWKGKVYNGKTFEYGSQGKYYINDGFRAYDSIDESIVDRAAFLKANSRYTKHGVFSAKSPAEQARALQSAGYATDPNYANGLINLINSSKLDRFDTPNPPKEATSSTTTPTTPSGDAGQGDGRVHYAKSRLVQSEPNSPSIETQRNIDAINRKINVAVNNINANDPTAYAEILKLIMEELKAINSNTAQTAKGVNNIEIVSANAPVSGMAPEVSTANTYQTASPKPNGDLRKLNTTTGYKVARQMASYIK
jgi:flagellum-specific peptidoglycan hydrolase FlgJ/phage-related protein